MAKQVQSKKSNSKEVHIPVSLNKNKLFPDFKMQVVVLAIIGFIIYGNSFLNEYALDDGIVIEKNDYVQQGFKGIPKILKTDAYDSFYRQMNAKQQLSGGRYRPLSVITFAIEQQLFGSKEKVKPPADVAFIRHLLNVLFYILSVIVLLYFLQTFIFKDTPLVAFITCLLFLIHPIHTEVISNVKSRDEILSFLFIILTFIKVFRYKETKKPLQLFAALVFYFCALLSKEYAVTLIILIPMLLYIVRKNSMQQAIVGVIPYVFVAAIYLLIRFSIVGKGATMENPDVLNNPYKFATSPEKWATKIEILNHYLRLLFFPHPLSSDYSYNTIPYTNFGNAMVWFAMLFNLSAIVATIILFVRRNIIAFALAFYLLHLLLVCNLLMDIGATMGERLIYHSSFGFILIVAIFLNWIFEKITSPYIKKISTISILSLITIGCAAIVIPRNAEWKNDTTLFITDAETVPYSALVNGNAGKAYLDLSEKPENKSKETELIKKAIIHLNRSVNVHKDYVNGYLNLGVAYYKLKEFDSARVEWDKVANLYPNNPYLQKNYAVLAALYYSKGMENGGKNPLEAIKYLEQAVQLDPNNAEYWYNLGGAYYTARDYGKARNAWNNTLQLNPAKEEAKQGLAALPTN